MKLIKILLSLSVMVTAAATVFGQGTPGVGTGGSGQSSPPFTPTLLQLPTATLTAQAAGGTETATNFYSGYTGFIGYTTNILGPLYGSSGFTPGSTNVVTNTETVYPSIYIPQSSILLLEYRGASSGTGGAGGSNVVFQFSQSLTGRPGLEPSTASLTWNAPVAGTGTNSCDLLAVTNLFGNLYLLSETLQATNGATFTNLDGGIYYAIEPLSQ